MPNSVVTYDFTVPVVLLLTTTIGKLIADWIAQIAGFCQV